MTPRLNSHKVWISKPHSPLLNRNHLKLNRFQISLKFSSFVKPPVPCFLSLPVQTRRFCSSDLEKKQFQEEKAEKQGKQGFFRKVLSNLEDMFKPKDEKMRTDEIAREIERQKGKISQVEVSIDTKKDISSAREDKGDTGTQEMAAIRSKKKSVQEDREKKTEKMEELLKDKKPNTTNLRDSSFEALGRKAMADLPKEEVENMQKAVEKGRFTMNEYRTQLKAAAKMQTAGKIGSKFASWLPGSSKWSEALSGVSGQLEGLSEEFKIQFRMIDAMTPEERDDPSLFEKNAWKRKERIVKEAGATLHEFNRLLDSFGVMQATQEYLGELRKAGKPVPNTMNEMMAHFQKEGIPKKLKNRIMKAQGHK